MVDIIFSYIAQSIILVIGCVLYIFLISKLLPALFLSPKSASTMPKDRGIKKYTFEHGRAIVYIPEPQAHKYIDQYILSENNGERFLKCKFDPRVVTALYEVTVFNSSDKVIDSIEVYDTPDCKEIARAVPLPLSAAYVNISVKEINRKKASVTTKKGFDLRSYLPYIILNFAATVILSLSINAAAIHVADLCLGFTDKIGNPGIGFQIFLAVIISAIQTAATIKGSRRSN